MAPLKMVAASSYIPKDTDNYPRDQDALFIHAATQTIGVADGVSGWSEDGIDAGEYARQLITKPGSSTACLVTLSRDNLLRAANVGDSGFLVIRDGAVSYRSPIQQIEFNTPYQLGLECNDPSVAEEIEFRAEKEDVVVLGKDGLLDNVHEDEILEFGCEGVEEGKDEEDLCTCLANRAYMNSFCERKAGEKSWRGGKQDDISVIVAMIEEEEEEAIVATSTAIDKVRTCRYYFPWAHLHCLD